MRDGQLSPGRARVGWPVALSLLGLITTGASQAATDTSELTIGKQLFISGAAPACAVCHTLKDAGTEGAIGPVLDELKPNAQRVATALRNGIGAMPAYPTLSEAQVKAIANYVAQATGAAP